MSGEHSAAKMEHHNGIYKSKIYIIIGYRSNHDVL